MSADSLVFDMSQVSDAPPQVFVRKDWLNILDNQSQNYSGNQCVIDTSQLANSNKYMNYREAYLSIPLLLTLNATTFATNNLQPATPASSCDYSLALKGWSGSLIHSITLDYNGTTIIQQTPLQSIWNVFKLQCSLSWDDVMTQGSTIGFYPDSALSLAYRQTASVDGIGICNNVNAPNTDSPVVSGAFNSYLPGNSGIARRQMSLNYDPAGLTAVGASAFSTLFTAASCNLAYKSYVINKINGATGATYGVFQQACMVQVKLKHLHSFFDHCPLLKGVFMRMTLNLNNTSFSFTSAGVGGAITLNSVSSAYSGVNPLMLCSAGTGSGNATTFLADTYIASVAVGASALASGVAGAVGVIKGPLAQSITLNVPAYTFNPTFESSYLSSPVKRIEYTDIYQYNVQNIASGGYVNQLITNGIAGIQSVLLVPVLTPVATAPANTGITVPQIQSPFDTAGCGTTAPLAMFTNFNIVVAGQNMIYNTERYTYEQFINQQYGHLAVNGGLTDGLTSGLIDKIKWETSQSYWWVDCSRMLPVEEQVPKSVNVIGNNLSALAIDLIVFVEYKCGLSIDVLSGARVA
jgi:hypothetical protein